MGRTGLTIHRYLARLRLREALERLTSSTSGPSEPALDLGFDTHFTAALHQEYGVTPRAIRRDMMTKESLRRLAAGVPGASENSLRTPVTAARQSAREAFLGAWPAARRTGSFLSV